MKGPLSRLARNPAGRIATVTSLGMLAGLAVDVLVARRLGATAYTDALVLGLTIPLILETVFRESSKFSLVPVLLPSASAGSDEALDLSGLLNFFLAVGAACVAAVFVLSPVLVRLLGPGLAEAAAARATSVLRLSVPLVAFSLAANCLAAYLNARGAFVFAASRYLSVSATVLAGSWFFTEPETFLVAVSGLHVAGYAVYLGALWWMVRGLGWRHSWRQWPGRRDLSRIISHVGWPTGGFLAGQAMRVAERALASTVAPGAVALYYFAFRIFNAVRNLVGMSIATVGLPDLARRHAAAQREAFRSAALRTVGAALCILVPVVVGLFIGADAVVDLLFGSGGFSDENVAGTAEVLRILALGLLFFGVTPVLMSGLYARREQRTIFGVMVATAVINLVLALFLTGTYGLRGLAVAFVASSVASVALAGSALFRRGDPAQ